MPTLQALALSMCLVGLAVLADAQAPVNGSPPRFEVASVKQSAETVAQVMSRLRPGEQPRIGIEVLPGGRFVASLMTPRALVLRAYGLSGYQLHGDQSWMRTEHFTINAKAEQPDATAQEMYAMLQTLLRERFRLRFRFETRPTEVHTLSFASSDRRPGPGLKPTTSACAEERAAGVEARLPDRRPAFDQPVCGITRVARMQNGGSILTMGGRPLSDLANWLSRDVGTHIVDLTGLDGLYDITLEYEARRDPPDLFPVDDQEPASPSLNAALPRQLGLTLQKVTRPLAVAVIEAMERPSPD